MTTVTSSSTGLAGVGARPVAGIAADLAVTLGAAALWILLSKGIGVVGKAWSLPDACWQLLAVRAAVGSAVISGMWMSRRGWFGVLGVLYGFYLGMTHASGLMSVLTSNLFIAAAVTGVFVGLLRWVKPSWMMLGTVLFMVGLAVPSLVRKVSASGVSGAGAWGLDMAIRLAAMGVVLVAVSIIRQRLSKAE